MDAFYLHAAVAAGWFAIQGLVLLNVPSVVTFLLLVPESRAATGLQSASFLNHFFPWVLWMSIDLFFRIVFMSMVS